MTAAPRWNRKNKKGISDERRARFRRLRRAAVSRGLSPPHPDLWLGRRRQIHCLVVCCSIQTPCSTTNSWPSTRNRHRRSGAGLRFVGRRTVGAEREQGITIDVAYRYFSTPRRSFIVADTPGHEQYTRNMATGASTAELAIILVDARKGILPQTRRHSFIVSMIGVRHVVLAVNKMDLVGFSQPVWQRIADEFAAAARQLGFQSIVPIPICARDGDNVVTRSARVPWFDGQPLLEYLETVDVSRPETEQGFAMPVQLVLRPDSEFRGYAGTVASGAVRVGQPVIALPSGQRADVARIVTADGDLAAAESGPGRHDHAEPSDRRCSRRRARRGRIIHRLSQLPLRPNYLDDIRAARCRARLTVRLGSSSTNARVVSIRHAIDIQTYAFRKPASLKLNEIGLVELAFDKSLVTRPYAEDRTLGAMILVDRLTHQTVGMATVQAVSDRPNGALLAGLPCASWMASSSQRSLARSPAISCWQR